MYSGVVPQHPPRIVAPSFLISSIVATKSSGFTSKIVWPFTTFGSPAFGFTITGTEAASKSLFTVCNISFGPRLQFTPIAETPNPSSIQTIDSGVEPLKVLPSAS